MNCRDCKTEPTLYFDEVRSFFKCPSCSLIFTQSIIEKESSEKHYKHQWEEQEEGFWKERADVFLFVVNKYRTPQKILDFGSGSGGLTKELQSRGLDVTPLEPMVHGYLKEQSFPEKFDVIAAVEVIEHLPNLWDELKGLEKVLTKDGIMLFTTTLTNSFIDKKDGESYFKKWEYKDDPTHVNFFCNKTIAAIAELGNYDIDIFGDNLFVIRLKP